MNKLFRFLLLAAALPPFLFMCSTRGIQWQPFDQSVSDSLNPGEKIGEMVITTGVEDAMPLWPFCVPTIENNHLIVVDCGETSYTKLAIGHTFGVMDLMPQPVDWEELTWQMELDRHPIDLEAFGTYDFVHPDLASGPSLVREVFRVMRVWDVVLVNPTPGAHRLRGQARSEEGTYIWVVNFIVVHHGATGRVA